MREPGWAGPRGLTTGVRTPGKQQDKRGLPGTRLSCRRPTAGVITTLPLSCLRHAQAGFAAVARAIARFEPMTVAATKEQLEAARAALPPEVDVVHIEQARHGLRGANRAAQHCYLLTPTLTIFSAEATHNLSLPG